MFKNILYMKYIYKDHKMAVIIKIIAFTIFRHQGPTRRWRRKII